MSALSASAAYTRHHHPGEPLFVMASTDALTEFAGQRLLSGEEADAPGAGAAAVVIGDAPEAVTFDNLNRAFRLVRGGAELIGMHRNPWWLTPAGPTLDSGALVTGLEFATERPARILGKPSAAFFREAAAELADEVRRGGRAAARPARDRDGRRRRPDRCPGRPAGRSARRPRPVRQARARRCRGGRDRAPGRSTGRRSRGPSWRSFRRSAEPDRPATLGGQPPGSA